MISFLAGLVYANAGEWLIHKYVLHGIGKNKDSMWSFHWNEHHRLARKNDFVDPSYHRFPIGFHAQGKEVMSLIGLGLLHLPLMFVSPGFTAGVLTSACLYYYAHKKSHKDPVWAKKYLRHHYDHHMGKNQDANWCVTFPLFDWIMGTRKKMQ